ncbi:thioredoxin-like 4, chloroplastic [Quercus suber]|uniref:Thioredoxin-like 4, chloroplastic n=1 Tax=Quercus suber TaxID=58331 RepID=A0AAW0M9Y7_QUESU
MQRQSIRYCKAYFGFGKNTNGHLDSRFPCIVPSFLHDRSKVRLCLIRAKIPSTIKTLDTFQAERIRVAEGNQGELSDEDDDLCPAECVREFKTDEELSRVLEKAKETDSLVVVDFYRPSCGSCKYIEQGFGKLCRGSGDQDAPVIFLKHNVIDEYDEQSEVADRLRIKSVPLFHFYKDGVLLEAFPTRDKERITAAIRKYTSPAS